MVEKSDPAYEAGSCPDCGSNRADVKERHLVNVNTEVYDSHTVYSILECRGCGTVYFKYCHSNSEDQHDYYDHNGEHQTEYIETVRFWPPSSGRKKPEWLDDLKLEDWILGSLLSDVFTAISNDLDVLAAIGIRTTFDRATELIKIDPGLTFNEKLKALQEEGHITIKELSALKVLVDAGSAAAHRGWRPKAAHLDDMMSILESFLYRTFLLTEVAGQLEKNVPARQKSSAPKLASS